MQDDAGSTNGVIAPHRCNPVALRSLAVQSAAMNGNVLHLSPVGMNRGGSSKGIPAPVVRPLGDLDDGQLIERCIRGDRPALGELYQRYKPEAMRFIRHSV